MTHPALTVLRPHPEDEFAEELEELTKLDKAEKNYIPPNWKLSAKAVFLFVMGGTLKSGFKIKQKYIGDPRIVQTAIVVLNTSSALLLEGEPGTGKSILSETISAAVCGKSTRLVQGTGGTDESALRYSWDIAKMLKVGNTIEAITPSPLYHAMNEGEIFRFEEMSRTPSEVQDTLITILSEKTLQIPELNMEIQARPGFNVIATANTRDKGVNEKSSALTRRFSTVTLPSPKTLEEEVHIVMSRTQAMIKKRDIQVEMPAKEEVERVVTMVRELRLGKTSKNEAVAIPSGSLSSADSIAIMENGVMNAKLFGDGRMTPDCFALELRNRVVLDAVQDKAAWDTYIHNIVRPRKDWDDFYRACMEIGQ